jgi:putative membrane protein
VPGHFSAHMIVHVAVVAVAAPLLAIGVAGSRADATRRRPWLAAPVPAMLVEFVVVWGWHLPLLHEAARASAAVLLVEQASFLAVGLLLWLSVLGGAPTQRRQRLAGGVVALLLTSMHMTLLGALITLAPRVLYNTAAHTAPNSPLADQQFAGMVMLSAAASYLAGGLWAVARLLREEERHAPLG